MSRIAPKKPEDGELLEKAKEAVVSAIENLLDHTPDELIKKRIKAFCREFKNSFAFDPKDSAGRAMHKR